FHCVEPIAASGGGSTIESAALNVRLYPGTQVSNGINFQYLLEADTTTAKSGVVQLLMVCVEDGTTNIASVNSTAGFIPWTRPTPDRTGFVNFDATGQCGLGEHRELLTVATIADAIGSEALNPPQIEPEDEGWDISHC